MEHISEDLTSEMRPEQELKGLAKTVKIDHEGQTKSGMLEEVPKWFVEKEGKKGFLNKKEKLRDISLAIIGGLLFFVWVPFLIIKKIVDIVKRKG